MHSLSNDPLQRLQNDLNRLHELQKEAETLLRSCDGSLRACMLANREEAQIVLGRMALQVFPQPTPDGRDFSLCFQPSLSCLRGFEVKIWEPSSKTRFDGVPPGPGDSGTARLLPFDGGRQELKTMLLPHYGLMLTELLRTSGLVEKK